MSKVFRIIVEGPMDLVTPEHYSDLFDAVADAVHEWEPDWREGWDMNVYTWTGPSEEVDRG